MVVIVMGLRKDKTKMVSVIIPTYNRGNTIKKAIESVLNQTYDNLEVIVVDDGSLDDTKNIVKAICDSRVKYVFQNNNGACAARNKGIELAKGEYIAFQDSDDYWYPQKIETQLKALEAKKGDIIISFFCRHNSDGSCKILPEIEAGAISKRKIEIEPRVSTQTILARKEVFQRIKFDARVPRFQDYEWSLRAAKEFTFYIPQKPLVDVYVQTDSITNNSEKKFKAYEYMIDKYHDDMEVLPVLLDRLAFFKAMDGINDVELLKRKYKIEKNRKNFLKYIMARIHVYSLYNKIRNSKKNKL